MRFRTVILACIFAGLSSLAVPSQARARGILIVINTGDTFMAEQPLPPAIQEVEHDATHLGYHCQHFGLFWLTLWTWEGHWCVYNDKVHYALPDDAAAMALGITGTNPGKPFFYRFPFGLFLITVVIGGWTGYEVFKFQVNKWSAALAKRKGKPRPQDDLPDNQDDEIRQKQAAIEAHVARLLSEGLAQDAHRLYVNSRQKLGNWDLPPETQLALIVALDREKQHADVLPLLLRYVERVPGAPVRLRLKLAQLLLTVQPRPAKALEVLAAIDAASLDDKSQKIIAQLRAQAERLAADEESELRLAD
ncbi:MAG: hypothetical protein K8T25_11300 [Planctomycetia bacterium]|nr:hypothetical protein [Planctomycetia bacterium]